MWGAVEQERVSLKLRLVVLLPITTVLGKIHNCTTVPTQTFWSKSPFIWTHWLGIFTIRCSQLVRYSAIHITVDHWWYCLMALLFHFWNVISIKLSSVYGAIRHQTNNLLPMTSLFQVMQINLKWTWQFVADSENLLMFSAIEVDLPEKYLEFQIILFILQ